MKNKPLPSRINRKWGTMNYSPHCTRNNHLCIFSNSSITFFYEQPYVVHRLLKYVGEVYTHVILYPGYLSKINIINYFNDMKRICLNRCIYDLYLYTDRCERFLFVPPIYSETIADILEQLDAITYRKVVPKSPRRQLFRPDRTPRKLKNPKQQVNCNTQLLYFKPQREMLGVHKIRRRFMTLSRIATAEQLYEGYTKYAEMTAPTGNIPHNLLPPCFGVIGGIYAEHADMFENITKFHTNSVVRKQMSNLLTSGAAKSHFSISKQIVKDTIDMEALLVHEQARLAMQKIKNVDYEKIRLKFFLRHLTALDRRHQSFAAFSIALIDANRPGSNCLKI